MILNWTKGNIKIYTKRLDIAQRAIREGNHVVTLKNKSRIFCRTQLYLSTQAYQIQIYIYLNIISSDLGHYFQHFDLEL